MRVITGKARGTRLTTLQGVAVRPTSEKVKEAIFSAIHFRLEGAKVLDLFAGSGQLGIEALSRGAASAVFVDSSKASLDIVKKNLLATKLEDFAKIVLSDYSSYLLRSSETFDFAFLDPPYAAGLLEDAINKTAKLMSNNGMIICEHPPEVTLPSLVSDFSIVKEYKYGKISVTVYAKES